MKYFHLFIASMLAIYLLLPLASAQSESTCIYLFYGEGCPHCGRVVPFVSELEGEYDIEVKHFEIYNNWDNAALLNSYFDAYNVPLRGRGVPVIFVGNGFLVGDTPILSKLEPILEKGIYAGEPCPSTEVKNPVNLLYVGINNGAEPGEGTVSGLEPEEISLGVITIAAFVDSINPCAIAVLLILLNALLAAGDKNTVLKVGLAFIASIYISYFLFGLGLFSAIQIAGLSYIFYQLVGFLAIIIGLFNIKDYLWYGGGGFVMEIPRSWRPTLKKLLKSITTPLGAFSMGFAVCLFELPCTGGPYIFILGLLAEKSTQMIAIPLLLYYNFIFILPLLGIVALLYYGFTNIEKAEKWKERNLRLLHLIAGILMLALGFWALSGVLL
ncbi:hypothetical protein DRN67_01895 [Candidatus Micrarchaeota archaeon]|nr:MAG: hypothetical protein DRN67_01895 [Candidatus Micrarchaeota archaeon]